MKKLTFLGLLMNVGVMAQTPTFQPQVIDNQVGIGYGLAIGDVDGDKKPDILLADQKQIVWYRNGDWKRFVMAGNLTTNDNVCIAARDIDGDGKVEVAVGANWNPGETNDANKSGSVHYLIRPADPTQLWEPIELHHEVTIHRMRWAKLGPRKFQLIVVPLHGKGNQNGEGKGVRIYAYCMQKNPKSAWKYKLIDSTMHMTHNFEIWEDKNATHLIIAGKEGGKIMTYEQNKWQFTKKWIGKDEGIGEIRRGYLPDNQTFIAAVEPMHGNKLVVFKNGERKVLTENLNQGHALVCADLLGLGYSQILVGWRNQNEDKKVGIKLFVPQKNGSWEESAIDDNTMATEDMQVADLDGDGKLDIIASGRATKNLVIYWNKRL